MGGNSRRRIKVKIKTIFIFAQGMVAVLDEHNEQIPEFQDFIFNLDFRKMGKHITKDTEVNIHPGVKCPVDWWIERRAKERAHKHSEDR